MSRYVIPYSLADIPIVRKFNLLAVVYNWAFNYNAHVLYLPSISCSELFSLRVISRHLTKANCIDIYNSLSRPVVEYCPLLLLI